MYKYKIVLVHFMLIISYTISAQTFTLKSNDLQGQATNKQLSNIFGCSGENISPELHWVNPPANTKAFAITMFDMDAPTGSGFWHWIIYNLPASTTSLASNAGATTSKLPSGAVTGINDAGIKGYLGPCPPQGQLHCYIITVVALKSKLEINPQASATLTSFIINQNTLAKASLVIYAQE